jgi:hypothetical protein
LNDARHGSCRKGPVEVVPVGHTTVALRERGRLAALFQRLWHKARQQPGWREVDRRNTRVWQQVLLGVLVARATRLLALGQVILASGARGARTTKAVAVGLGRWLAQAHFDARPVAMRLLEAGVRQLDVARLATYRGKAVVAIDPTDYAKRRQTTPSAAGDQASGGVPCSTLGGSASR